MMRRVREINNELTANSIRCQICTEEPKTQTTYERTVTTLSGDRIIRFRKKYCRNHGLINRETLSTIQKICPRKRTFDTKVIIAIGFLRWLFNYQREEIQLLLESRGIHISTGEISKLSEEFLLRFYVLHKKHNSAKEGMTGFTIDSWIMPSESSEYIKPFLESIRDKYRKPLAVVRDMSEQIHISVSEVFPGVSQQVCHYHFVRNLGDIRFKHLYQEFRREILKTNALARILALKKICMDGISSQDRIVMAEHYWVMLAIEYVLYPRERKSDYPFVLPYLEVMNRLMEVLGMLKKIVMWTSLLNRSMIGLLCRYRTCL